MILKFFLEVQANDVDTGVYGKVFFTNILGNVNQSLSIDSMTGVISVATNNHGFDRESAQGMILYLWRQ